MSNQHSFDRYSEARFKKDHADKALNDTADLLERVARSLRQRPLTFPIEGIGEWTEIRTKPGVLQAKDWPDFARLRTLVESYTAGAKEEARAFNLLPEGDQKLINRP